MRAPDVCARTGATYRQLDYWAHRGYASPSLQTANGSGTQREYSREDVAFIGRLVAGLHAGLTMQAALTVAHGESNTGRWSRRTWASGVVHEATRQPCGLGWPGDPDVWLSDRVKVSVT